MVLWERAAVPWAAASRPPPGTRRCPWTRQPAPEPVSCRRLARCRSCSTCKGTGSVRIQGTSHPNPQPQAAHPLPAGRRPPLSFIPLLCSCPACLEENKPAPLLGGWQEGWERASPSTQQTSNPFPEEQPSAVTFRGFPAGPQAFASSANTNKLLCCQFSSFPCRVSVVNSTKDPVIMSAHN